MISDKDYERKSNGLSKKMLAISFLVGAGALYATYNANLKTSEIDESITESLVAHEVVATRRYCGKDTSPHNEKQISKLDDCKTHCQTARHNGKSYAGYWWKGWGGGYCGCCASVDNLTTNWPDATTYRLPPVITHDLVASRRYCGKDTSPHNEKQISKLDDCKTHCQTANKNGKSYEGYWWKAWGGGYCGCCGSVDNLTTNWPDASTYRLPQPPVTHTLVAAKRYCGKEYPHNEMKISKLDDCKAHCLTSNAKNGKSFEGYWWKAWGGGYCGCCSSTKNLTSNWPDASTYSLPITHDLVAAKRYCGKEYPHNEMRISKLDDCKAHCQTKRNNHGKSFEGYWWKAWGGGYCGCCSSTGNLTSNWPDATTYKLPAHNPV